MKHPLLTLLLACSLSGMVQAQGFTGNVSGTLGLLNPKLRFQYEAPLMENGSFGLSATYYTFGWEGPMVEPFLRLYNKSYGNEKGFFGQVKAIYGNLSVMDYEGEYLVEGPKRWSTFGFGLNIGYKFLVGQHFTIEPITGLRLLTPPYLNQEMDDEEGGIVALGETLLWYLSTGLPIDFQLKFGFQF